MRGRRLLMGRSEGALPRTPASMMYWLTAAGAELRGITDPASRCAHRNEPRSGPRGGDRWEWTDRHERNGRGRPRLRDQAVSCLGHASRPAPAAEKAVTRKAWGRNGAAFSTTGRSCQPRARRRSPSSPCPGLAAILALRRRSVDRDRLTLSIKSSHTVRNPPFRRQTQRRR